MEFFIKPLLPFIQLAITSFGLDLKLFLVVVKVQL